MLMSIYIVPLLFRHNHLINNLRRASIQKEHCQAKTSLLYQWQSCDKGSVYAIINLDYTGISTIPRFSRISYQEIVVMG